MVKLAAAANATDHFLILAVIAPYGSKPSVMRN